MDYIKMTASLWSLLACEMIYWIYIMWCPIDITLPQVQKLFNLEADIDKFYKVTNNHAHKNRSKLWIEKEISDIREMIILHTKTLITYLYYANRLYIYKCCYTY